MKEQIKPELNNESKARFFAQYWEVPCIKNDDWIWRSKDKFKDIPFGLDIKECYAELKSLSSITDEDVNEVCIILGFKNQDISINRLFIQNHFENQYGLDKKYACTNDVVCAFDFLRSKGYAIPWMGHSVEDLVNAGWVKLKGVNTNG